MDTILQMDLYKQLDIRSYINCLQTSKFNYEYYNYDIAYRYYLEQMFSNNFIYNVKLIMVNYKDCIKRIYTFNNLCDCYNYPKWDESTYYAFWKHKYNHKYNHKFIPL